MMVRRWLVRMNETFDHPCQLGSPKPNICMSRRLDDLVPTCTIIAKPYGSQVKYKAEQRRPYNSGIFVPVHFRNYLPSARKRISIFYKELEEYRSVRMILRGFRQSAIHPSFRETATLNREQMQVNFGLHLWYTPYHGINRIGMYHRLICHSQS